MCCDKRGGADDLYLLMRDVFCAAAVTCFLWAMHRIAHGLKMQGRLQALDQIREAYTPEEREVLITKIKERSMSL